MTCSFRTFGFRHFVNEPQFASHKNVKMKNIVDAGLKMSGRYGHPMVQNFALNLSLYLQFSSTHSTNKLL